MGIRSFSTGTWDRFTGVTLRPGGRIVAVGTATSIRGKVSELDFLVARFPWGPRQRRRGVLRATEHRHRHDRGV